MPEKRREKPPHAHGVPLRGRYFDHPKSAPAPAPTPHAKLAAAHAERTPWFTSEMRPEAQAAPGGRKSRSVLRPRARRETVGSGLGAGLVIRCRPGPPRERNPVCFPTGSRYGRPAGGREGPAGRHARGRPQPPGFPVSAIRARSEHRGLRLVVRPRQGATPSPAGGKSSK